MSRAKEKALEAYPIDLYNDEYDRRRRAGFEKGYEQAQKDLELSWRDMQHIVRIADHLCNSLEYDKIKKMGEEGYYTEILDRFNKEKIVNYEM
jgi:hypothetical protein